MTEGNPESADAKVESATPTEATPTEQTAETAIEDTTEALAELQEKLQLAEDQLREVESLLAETEKKAAEYLDGWQRSQASFANFRKRTEAEQAQWRSTANAQILSRLIPVLDDFKRAFEAVPATYTDDAWLEGIRIVQRKLKAILDAENVKPIELKPGDAFDPKYHEAVLYQEVEGFEEGQIVAEVEAGYMLGERVLRPSVVVVAKGAPQPVKPKEEPSAEPGASAESPEDTDERNGDQDA